MNKKFEKKILLSMGFLFVMGCMQGMYMEPSGDDPSKLIDKDAEEDGDGGADLKECIAQEYQGRCTRSCECLYPYACTQDPTRLSLSGGGCCKVGEYWIEQLGICQSLFSDGFCFGFEPFVENCATSKDDCCTCGGKPGDMAYLHGDVWPFWYNYRTVCDNKYKAYWRCQLQGKDCTTAKQERDACNRCEIIKGLCNERSGPDGNGCHIQCDNGQWCDNWADPAGNCGYGYYSSCHPGCAVTQFDYDALWGHYYGSSWSYMDHWYILFYDGSGTDITASVKPGVKGDVKRDEPPKETDAFCAFGCYGVPSGSPIKVRVALTGWENNLPRDEPEHNIYQTFTPEPGKHYVWDYRGLYELKGGCDIPDFMKEALHMDTLSCPSSLVDKAPLLKPEDIPCWPPEKGVCPAP